jgi:hypothetical protein
MEGSLPFSSQIKSCIPPRTLFSNHLLLEYFSNSTSISVSKEINHSQKISFDLTPFQNAISLLFLNSRAIISCLGGTSLLLPCMEQVEFITFNRMVLISGRTE